MIRSMGLSALLVTCTLVARAAPPTPELTAQAFVDAWNSHDAQNFEGLFTEDAWWVPVVESRLSGRAQIVADLKQAHAIWAGRTTMASSDVVVSPLSDSAAAVLFKAGFLGQDGKRMEPPNVLLLAVVKTPDGWRIKAGQLSKPGATAMPAK
ncbi:YybH family protein [Roseateles aquatilis]|nr:SgcJ/EcaC family oxidoreductase [Roseateles aquatilis]